MTTLIITRGLPASGKTRWARAWVAEAPTRRVRVNRDDLRLMAHDRTWINDPEGEHTEKAITVASHAAIAALLAAGTDVVCDDTNLRQRTARELHAIAARTGANFDVWDLTDVPLETCIRRDATRTGTAFVGEPAIRRMHDRYLAGKPRPLPWPDLDDTAAPPAPYVPPRYGPPAVLVDVDGTAALMNGRSPYDETRVSEDRPNRPVLDAVRAMHAAGRAVLFMSGRTEACRPATEAWLTEHAGIPVTGLHMRAVGDTRKDAVVKAELFDRHIRSEWAVTAVFDDRDQVVNMWRSMGLTVFQVAPGAF